MPPINKDILGKYKITMEFGDESDYQYFLEMQAEYPKLRRFCEEFERQLRSWRKHGQIPDSLENIDVPPGIYDIFAREIERWYYSTKEECDE